MGKAKKNKMTDAGKSTRSLGLVEHILEDKSIRTPGRTKTRRRKDSDDEFVDDRLSHKILEQARKQQEELEDDHGVKAGPKGGHRHISLGGHSGDGETAEQSDSEGEDESGEQLYCEDIKVCEEDEKALERFMSHQPPTRRTLADIIQEKITEKKTEIQTQMSDNASIQMQQLDDRVISMYKSIRDILKKYRSGKLPKAFKIVPSLSNWEQILYLTEPDAWSAAAVYQASRIFASNLNAHMAQRFFNLVLLPRIRDDIEEYKRLNYHLYQALKKSLFKPAAFFKGVLLPLCESGCCTLREAVIVGSILSQNSIPMLHSAAAMLKIAEMDYNGANSIFLRALLDKKYALPYRVIDAMVFHFLKMTREKRELPVLWHQSLLTFAQRYKNDLATEQRDALMDLLRVQTHHSMTPEIRRELQHAQCRDEPGGGATGDVLMDD